MPEPKRKNVDNSQSFTGSPELESNGTTLDGFEQFFKSDDPNSNIDLATSGGEELNSLPVEKLLNKLGDLIALTVDQRAETAKIANQLIDNQRQLIATQQILIRLMEKSIELTRHVTAIEEKLPVLFELPKTVENLKSKMAYLENVEPY